MAGVSSTRRGRHLGVCLQHLLLHLLLLATCAAATNLTCPDPPLKAARRASAGWRGISRDECLARKFCWDSSCTACFQCYKPVEVLPVVDYTAGTTPRNLEATVIGTKTLQLQWDPPKYLTFNTMHDGRRIHLAAYTLRFSCYDQDHQFEVNSTSTNILLDSFIKNATYLVVVTAIYGDRKTRAVGYPAAWKTFAVQNGVPWPPVHLQVKRDDQTVVIKWENRPGNVDNTKFELQYSCGGKEQKRIWIEGNIRDLVLRELNEEEDCIFRMAGVNMYGVGPTGNPIHLLASRSAMEKTIAEDNARASQTALVASICVVIIVLVILAGLAVFYFRRWKKRRASGVQAYVERTEYQGLNLSDIAQASNTSAIYTDISLPFRIHEEATTKSSRAANTTEQKRQLNEYVDSPIVGHLAIPQGGAGIDAELYANWEPQAPLASVKSNRDKWRDGGGLVKTKFMVGEVEQGPQTHCLLPDESLDVPSTVAPSIPPQQTSVDSQSDYYEDVSVPGTKTATDNVYENLPPKT